MLDLTQIIRARLETPRPFRGVSKEQAAALLGAPILRQLWDRDTAPGGYSALRFSNLGSCRRALAYRLLAEPPNGRKRDARSTTTFALGDMTEALLVAALEDALEKPWSLDSLRTTTGGQRSVDLRVKLDGLRMPIQIKGHPDGVITKNGKPIAVLEVKSTSSYGYDRTCQRLANHQDPWTSSDGYWWQAQAYIHSLNVRKCAVLMLCKDSGHFTSWWIDRDPQYLDLLKNHLAAVVLGSDLPARVLADGTPLLPKPIQRYRRSGTRKNGTKYKVGQIMPGSGKLPWQCTYCEFHHTCYGGQLEVTAERDYRGRPSTALYLKGE